MDKSTIVPKEPASKPEMPSQPRAAFVFSQFPCYDEVFMLREMARLSSRLDLLIFSIRSARRDPIDHPETSLVAGRVRYAGLFFDFGVLLANIKTALNRPARYLSALREIWRMSRPDPDTILRSLAIFPQAVRFAEICRRAGISAVHGQWATYPAACARVISHLNGIPFSFTGHAHDIYLKTSGLPYKLEQARFVITCTGDNVRRLREVHPGLDAEKVKVIHHGVDLERFQPAGERAGGPFRILSVGSLFECKGFEYLIEACRLLQMEGFDCLCRIVGGGYLEKRLRAQAAQAGLSDRIEFTGYQSQEKMPGHYRWADLFVLPAVLRIHWGIPNVLIESLACAVPVACTPLPSLPELLGEPPCGFLIPEKNPGAIARLVGEMAADPEGRSIRGKRGRERIKKLWDIEKTSDRIAELFGWRGKTGSWP